MMPTDDQPTLFICVTCRAGEDLPEGGTPQGEKLHAAVAGLLEASPRAVTLKTTGCLANCERGCSGAIAADGKWTNLLGHLLPHHAADLLDYVDAYAASKIGTVMPSRRPASLARMIVGRVPGAPAAPAQEIAA
jgi:predicted metal-binding protein